MLAFIQYTGLFGLPTYREFGSVERAEQWCRQIGRKDLIRRITTKPENPKWHDPNTTRLTKT